MLCLEGQVKIVDFGIAAQIFPDENGRETICGTPTMMAPEILLQQKYDHKVDIWSAGVTAIELARGTAPNHNLSAQVLIFSFIHSLSLSLLPLYRFHFSYFALT